MDPSTLAVLGLGEGGFATARGLDSQSGWRSGTGPAEGRNRRLLAVDIALNDPVRGPMIRRHAEEASAEVSEGYGPELGEAEVVFSIITCDQSEKAAASAKPFLKPGTLYLDYNSITRTIAERNAALLEEGGVDYVDVAVMGSFHHYGYRPPLLIAGAQAEKAAAWLRPLGFDIEILPGAAGRASAVKILRSILMKGLEALAVEFMVAARHQGLLEETLACTGDVDRRGFRDFISMLVQSHLVHGRRRHEEVELVNQMLRESGIEPLMSLATERSHFRTIAMGGLREGEPMPELEEALRVLTDDVVKPSK